MKVEIRIWEVIGQLAGGKAIRNPRDETGWLNFEELPSVGQYLFVDGRRCEVVQVAATDGNKPPVIDVHPLIEIEQAPD